MTNFSLTFNQILPVFHWHKLINDYHNAIDWYIANDQIPFDIHRDLKVKCIIPFDIEPGSNDAVIPVSLIAGFNEVLPDLLIPGWVEVK